MQTLEARCSADDNPHDVNNDRPPASFDFSEEEEKGGQELQDERQQQDELKQALPAKYGTQTCNFTASAYSLTSGPSTTPSSSPNCSLKGNHHHLLASASPNSMASASCPPSLLEEHHLHPHAHCPAHIKALLSQLESSVHASKTAFALMQASSSPCDFAERTHSRARSTMAEELQTLPDLHMRLSYLIQNHAFGMKQDGSHEITSNGSIGPTKVDRQEAMLKSYEGIITRLHEEIRKKGAVTEALKATLAKSLLRGEKLERQTKALEDKLSFVELK